MTIRRPGRPATSEDVELFTLVEKHLYTAVLADALDELGYRDQVMRGVAPASGPRPAFRRLGADHFVCGRVPRPPRSLRDGNRGPGQRSSR